MRRATKCLLMAALLSSSGPAAHALADSLPEARDPAELLRPFVPAVSMETDRREAPEEWARRNNNININNINNVKSKIGARYGATGLVRCGGAVGTAQITLRADIITTAAHVLIDTNGTPRACTFQSAAGGAPVAIETHSIKAGSRNPMTEPATRDWAVARLVRPVAGATPYGLAQPGTKPAGVLMVAAGNKRADQMGAENCKARGMLSASWEGVREFAIDCNAAPGSSGAALTAGHKIVGIHVGYRSNDPARAQPFSATHYNFAITVEGPFRRALLAAAH